MGSSISRVYDDYDAYERLCEHLKIQPLDMYTNGTKSFYDHEAELCKEHNLYKTFWGSYKTRELAVPTS